jgi:hypothetical protein
MALSFRILAASSVLAILGTQLALGQTPPAPAPVPGQGQGRPQRGPRDGQAPTAPPKASTKPYEDVVTKEAKTQNGVFKVHRIGDQVLFEIPKALLGRDFLWMTEVAETDDANFGSYPGAEAGTQILRFEKHNDSLYMRFPDYSVRSAGDRGLDYGVAKATTSPIISSFEIKTYSKDGDPVIDVTRMFTSDPQDFSIRGLIGGAGVDPSRSYLDKLNVFPTNIETESVLTFGAGGQGGGIARLLGLGGGARHSAVTVTAHYSLVLLPEKPMQGRLRDSRVGFFGEGFTEYGNPGNGSKEKTFIARYRLEKKNPDESVSEPVKPITFYLAREVPDKWRSYLKKGIESWQPVFESAGFKNAIICKDAPSEKEDPKWDPEDARYSVIRWAPSTVFNAMGPHVSDPRSGETLSGHVIVWNDVVKLAQLWYFVQASPNDPSAQHLPLSDDLTGRCLAYIVAHEVGHVLGLEHNFKASAQFSVKELRDSAFTAKWGDEASIMDYGRFNYVAQPGDGATLIPKQGPYDYFAIQYGYSPAKFKNVEEDHRSLEPLLMKGVADNKVRFNEPNATDPQAESEDLGDDPVAASTLGFKNLDRVAGFIVPATQKYGEDYSDLAEAYSWLIRQRTAELFHVAKLVGGVDEYDSHGHIGHDYRPVSKARQAAAVKFMVEQGLRVSPALVSPQIVDRIQPQGVLSLIGSSQKSVIQTLFAESRLGRLLENESRQGANAYTVSNLIDDVQGGVWSELHTPNPMIDVTRRNLQLRYLDVMQDRLIGSNVSPSEFKGLAKAALRKLRSQIVSELPHTTSPVVAAHLAECRDQIKAILDGKTVAAAAQSFSLAQLLGGWDLGCGDGKVLWPEGLEPATGSAPAPALGLLSGKPGH